MVEKKKDFPCCAGIFHCAHPTAGEAIIILTRTTHPAKTKSRPTIYRLYDLNKSPIIN